MFVNEKFLYYYLLLFGPIVFLLVLLAMCLLAGEQKFSLFCFINRLRASTPFLRAGCSGVLLLPFFYLLYLSNIPGLVIDLRYFGLIPSTDGNVTKVTDNGGLRIVVFGGGDVATPNLSASERDSQRHGWTEVMCAKLGCHTYLNFVPKAEGLGGAVLSNSLLDAAYRHVSTINGTTELDYSWVEEQYPMSHQPDLAAQVDSFLSASRTHRTAAETLWVFNVGYWDIWYLAALPRKLATDAIDSSVGDMFFQIERLYQASKARGPDTLPKSNPTPVASNSTVPGHHRADRALRAPFRIFLTKLFDISLTPGFAGARPRPPHPHCRTSQLRNAAFLTNYWNALLEAAVDEWLATPDPEHWSTTDRIDTRVVEALVRGKPLPAPVNAPEKTETQKQKHTQGDAHGPENVGNDEKSSLPRRKFASYGVARYLRELMIEHQLRAADLFDHKGLGARPAEEGFADITMPCTFVKSTGYGETSGVEEKVIECGEPNNYLFYTGFTVGQRAIHEIGIRAARRLLEQVEESSLWKEKVRMRKGGGR